jgi:hypothetical protein
VHERKKEEIQRGEQEETKKKKNEKYQARKQAGKGLIENGQSAK